MTRKKVFTLFIVLALGFVVLELRLFFLMTDSAYTEAASTQSTYKKEVAVNRPNFFDCHGQPLTGDTQELYAIALPQSAASRNILKYSDAFTREEFDAQMRADVPFLVKLSEPMPVSEPIGTVSLFARHGDATLARHLLGYLDYDKHGVTGLEYVFDDYLSQNTTSTLMAVDVDALGRALGSAVTFYESDYSSAQVQLTIDKGIQALAEIIADSSFTRGAIVVLDADTFEIKAMVSRPNYLQTDIAAAIEHDNGALVNRAVNAYTIGSVYKPVVAAAALEAGIPESFTHVCEGSITVNGFTYSCNNNRVHGEMDMESALAYSCNTYFIALGQAVGSEAIYNMAVSMGLGKPLAMFEDYETARGSMPGVAQLARYNELCNHSFGQGMLLASPMHVAAYTAAIANGGVMRGLSVVRSVGGQAVAASAERRVMSAETAEMIARGLAQTMAVGTGSGSRPQFVTAAGKTGTAQTGVYNSNGVERINGWFTGWFPADNPQYVVTVMVEDEGYGFESAAPVFSALADALWESY